MSARTRSLILVVLGLIAALAPMHALTQPGNEPSTSEALAVLRVLHDPALDERITCTGSDGQYVEIRAPIPGKMTSVDERMSGDVVGYAWILLNVSTLKGTAEIDVEVRDPASGALKLSGHVHAVFQGFAPKGMLVGTLADGSRVVANFSGWHPPSPPGAPAHEETLTFGGPTEIPTDPAVIQQESCSGVVGFGPRAGSVPPSGRTGEGPVGNGTQRTAGRIPESPPDPTARRDVSEGEL